MTETVVEKLSTDEFEVYATPWIPGRQVLQNFGFDEDKCLIEVLEGESLSITQEGKMSSFVVGPGLWRYVSA